jgi:D-3-phosphoglycerate dehydrogenase
MGSSLVEVGVELWGVEEGARVPVTVAALKGALMPFLGEAVNYVNAEKVAEGRGIEVVRSVHHRPGEYPHLVAVKLKGEGREVEVAGTVFGERDPRVVRFEGYRLEFRPQGFMLVVRNLDVPGVVGKLGTLLGEASVNIAEIHLARDRQGDEAMAVLRLDQQLSPETLERLTAIPEVTRAQMIDLRRS